MRRRTGSPRWRVTLPRLLRGRDGLLAVVAMVIVLYLIGGKDFLSRFGLDVEGADAAFIQTSPAVIAGWAEVTDGDSLRINGERIRIVGIDAPELRQYCLDGARQIACGQLSRQHMAMLIDNRSVSCRWLERDKYRRILGHCTVENASGHIVDLNRAMVEDGWAFSYSAYPHEEKQARANKRGMWVWKVQNPYQWRRANPRSE